MKIVSLNMYKLDEDFVENLFDKKLMLLDNIFKSFKNKENLSVFSIVEFLNNILNNLSTNNNGLKLLYEFFYSKKLI